MIRRPSEVLRADEEEDKTWGKVKEGESENKENDGKRMDVRTMVMSELMQWVDEMIKTPGDQGHRDGSDIDSFARGVSALLR